MDVLTPDGILSAFMDKAFLISLRDCNRSFSVLLRHEFRGDASHRVVVQWPSHNGELQAGETSANNVSKQDERICFVATLVIYLPTVQQQ